MRNASTIALAAATASAALLAGCANHAPAPEAPQPSAQNLQSAASASSPAQPKAAASKWQTEYRGSTDLAKATVNPEVAKALGQNKIGGLSGIDRQDGDHYLVLSDAKGAEDGPVRAFDLNLAQDAQGGTAGAVFNRMIKLTDQAGKPFADQTADPESVRTLPEGFMWTSEGNAKEGVAPGIFIADKDGKTTKQFEIPNYHKPGPNQSYGIRHNKAYEGLAVDKEHKTATVATEGPLVQDGPAISEKNGGTVRLTTYDVASGKAAHEYALPIDAAWEPNTDRGVSEIIDAGDGSLLVLERGYTKGKGNHAEIYRVKIDGATDVLGKEALDGKEKPVSKELVFDFANGKGNSENVEGMAWGPKQPDGRRTLLVLSDNNFSEKQKSLVHTLAIKEG